MPAETYARNVLNNHASPGSLAVAQMVIDRLMPSISAWANGHLIEVRPSGSVAKGTAVIGCSDVDILISVSDTVMETLKEVYEKLYNRLTIDGFAPRKQNVSLGITLDGWKVDVVPAKRRSVWTTEHSLWSHKKQSWRQTNIHKHVEYVTASGRVDEIRLVKVWKKLHNLEFPSFPLEVAVINALAGHPYGTLADNFPRVLEYIRDKLPEIQLIDPTKPSNVLSDELTPIEKALLASTARQHLQLQWEQVVW